LVTDAADNVASAVPAVPAAAFHMKALQSRLTEILRAPVGGTAGGLHGIEV
jgi:hypothetical protein